MNRSDSAEARDFADNLMGNGCLVSIPILLGLGMRFFLGYAKRQQYASAHQVEEVELEGDAAKALDDGASPKELIQRFSKKITRIAEQYSKTGAHFDPIDFKKQKSRLDYLVKRLGPDAQEPSCAAQILKVQQLLQRYAPPNQ